MNIEFDFITPFYLGAKDIFEQLLNSKVNVSQINNIETENTLADVTVDLEIKSNNFTGKVYYFMDKEFVVNVLKVMIGDMPLDFESEMTKSALLELNNMVTGRALTKLAEMGFIYNMSVPEIILGKGTQFSENSVSLSLVKLDTNINSFTIGFLTSSVEKLVRPKVTENQPQQRTRDPGVSVSSASAVTVTDSTNNKSLFSQITEITLSSINEVKDLKGEPDILLKKGELITKLANNALFSKQIPDHDDNKKVLIELKKVISATLDEIKVLKGNSDFSLKKNMIVAELAKVLLDVMLEIVS